VNTMTAALDPNYMLAPSLEMYFVNKDTGLPLSGGEVFFYKDQARSVPKPVYQIVSAAPGGPYTYDILPNPVSLSAVGTFQDDNNNNILPYYLPFDDLGNIELYYIEVYDSLGVLQFTREAWPNFTEANVTADQDVTNFIPNGQFVTHTNIPATISNGYVAGKVTSDHTEIAQGGWSFDRTAMSTAIDIVTFPEFTSSITQPTGNPRFAVQIQTTVAGSDTEKDLRCKFPNVNTFASNILQYNLYFEGYSTTGSDITNCQILLRKFFGTGGSPSSTTETSVGTFTLLAQQNKEFNFSILFGTNESKSLGTNSDDYVQIVVRLPPTGIQTALMTDFALTVNNEVLTSFPTQTQAEQLDQSLAGWFPRPDPDGFDLFLPIRLTKTGLEFDRSEVGKVHGCMYTTPGVGELFCDGSMYETAGYSSDGIPYERLQQVLYNTSLKTPIFGTGPNFFASVVGTDNKLIIATNKIGSATASSAGTTTFGIRNSHTGANYGMQCEANSTTGVFGWATREGAVTDASAGTSGFTVVSTRNLSRIKQAISISNVAAAAGLAGLYFLFSSTTGSYYVWFKVDGTGADPAVGGRTGILIDLASTQAASDVAKMIGGAMSGFQETIVTTAAASAITTGQYFTINTSTPTAYYVWYKKDGVGTDPAPGGTGIQVNIIAGDTAAQVASKTMIAMNNKYFAVPDLRGWFLRGWDDGATIDPTAISRAGLGGLGLNYGDHIGTLQIDEIQAHIHNTIGGGNLNTFNFPYYRNDMVDLSTPTDVTGTAESRPVNISVAWMIKY
jgi:hypothetical protein